MEKAELIKRLADPVEGWLLNSQIFWSRGNDRFFDELRIKEGLVPIPAEEAAAMRKVMGITAKNQTLMTGGKINAKK